MLEACGSSHYWARKLRSLGHDLVLLPPHLTRPYRTGNKTDRADAKALLEAFRNDEICPVPVKSADQQAMIALHRLRSAWMRARTSRINTVRGVLREIGIAIPVGARHVVPNVRAMVEDPDTAITDVLRATLYDACEEIRALEARIQSVETRLNGIARVSEPAKRLRTIPGIGLLTSTALVAFIGDARRFPTARHFASYLGLTPREYSSGSKRRLGRISKRGDGYIRMLLTHGARAVLLSAKRAKSPDRIRAWGLELQARQGHNKATIGLANKLSRIVWAVWTREEAYRTLSAVSQPACA